MFDITTSIHFSVTQDQTYTFYSSRKAYPFVNRTSHLLSVVHFKLMFCFGDLLPRSPFYLYQMKKKWMALDELMK